MSSRTSSMKPEPSPDGRAPRSRAFLDRSVAWIVHALQLRVGSCVLDLGCGDGQYAGRLAHRGIRVMGIDLSRPAIDDARSQAAREGLAVVYRRGDYLDVDLGRDHDAALLLLEAYGELSPAQRALLLLRVRDALRPGGHVLLDVPAPGPRAGEIGGMRELRDGGSAPRLALADVIVELGEVGFGDVQPFGDVAGAAYDDAAPVFAVIARRD